MLTNGEERKVNTASQSVVINIPNVILNSVGLYEGNLTYYFKLIFYRAQNLYNPYHNFRHMLHVTRLCYLACEFYADVLTKRKMRDLLIAAMFHDFDHTGKAGPDSVNIERALLALGKYLLPEDRVSFGEIQSLVQLSQYPYLLSSDKVGPSAQILRDADVAQAINPAWIQQVVFGLAAEWGKNPIEVLNMQVGFHSNINFVTKWAQGMFPREVIDAKVAEAKELAMLLA